MLLYLHASKAVAASEIDWVQFLDAAQDQSAQSSMPRVLHILYLRNAMMQAKLKREQPQTEYYLVFEIPNCCSGQLCVVWSLITTASKFRSALGE
jgi:hypothetical protein